MTNPMHNNSNQVPVPQTPVQNIDEMDYQLPDDGPFLPTPECPTSNATERELQNVDTSHHDVFVGPDTDPFEIFDHISTLSLPPMPSNFFDEIPVMDLYPETEGPGAENRSSPDTDPSAPLPKEPGTTTLFREEASGYEIVQVENPLICHICMGLFPDHRSLFEHIKQRHQSISTKEWKWKCMQCNRIIASKQHYAPPHLNREGNTLCNGLFEHVCECGARFCTSNALALHRMAQHPNGVGHIGTGTGNRRTRYLRAYRCLYCGQTSKQKKSGIERHIAAIHNRYKPS